MSTRPTSDEDVWLEPDELRAWITLCALMGMLSARVDAQLQRDCGLTFFEYGVMAMLSEQPDRTATMTSLAMLANGSLSRLSHVVKRMETRGLIGRKPLPGDGRVTLATLTPKGLRTLESAAPDHARTVRRLVFDALTPDDVRALTAAGAKAINAIDPAVGALVERAAGSGRSKG